MQRLLPTVRHVYARQNCVEYLRNVSDDFLQNYNLLSGGIGCNFSIWTSEIHTETCADASTLEPFPHTTAGWCGWPCYG